MSIPSEILGLMAGVAVLVFLRLLFHGKPAPSVPSKPVPEIPGIASHEKWKASLKLYEEGKIRLEDFVEAWSGWTVLPPVPKYGTMTQKEIVNRALEQIANPPLVTKATTSADGRYIQLHYTVGGSATGSITTNVVTSNGSSHDNVDLSGWMNPRYGAITGKDYGPLYTSKSKLGGGA